MNNKVLKQLEEELNESKETRKRLKNKKNFFKVLEILSTFIEVPCIIITINSLIASSSFTLPTSIITIIWVIVSIISIKNVQSVDKELPELEETINFLEEDIRKEQTKGKIKSNTKSSQVKNEQIINCSLEKDVYTYMNEYLANVDSFSDKEQAFFELMKYVKNNLTEENCNRVTSMFANCFWKVVRDIENKELFIKAIYPEFKSAIIKYGEAMIGEIKTVKENYDQDAYITFMVYIDSNRDKSRKRD